MSAYMIWGAVLVAFIALVVWLRIRYPEGSRGRRVLKWLCWGTIAAAVALFLHYSLPHHAVVRITNTYNRLTTVSWENRLFYASPDVGTAESTDTRDIRFIDTVRANGKVMVFRNEDTGWVWPPYFKYDSSNLQAEAGNLKSDAATPRWVAVTYYGWRIPFLSIYPNAIKAKEVAGPDVRIIPWGGIIVVTLLAIIALLIRRMWLQFRERTIDPVTLEINEALDGIETQADEMRKDARTGWGRFKARLGIGRKG